MVRPVEAHMTLTTLIQEQEQQVADLATALKLARKKLKALKKAAEL
jgi:hypothetical protein